MMSFIRAALVIVWFASAYLATLAAVTVVWHLVG